MKKTVHWRLEVRGMTGFGWFGFQTFTTRKDADEVQRNLPVASRLLKVTAEVVQPSRRTKREGK